MFAWYVIDNKVILYGQDWLRGSKFVGLIPVIELLLALCFCFVDRDFPCVQCVFDWLNHCIILWTVNSWPLWSIRLTSSMKEWRMLASILLRVVFASFPSLILVKHHFTLVSTVPRPFFPLPFYFHFALLLVWVSCWPGLVDRHDGLLVGQFGWCDAVLVGFYVYFVLEVTTTKSTPATSKLPWRISFSEIVIST